MLVTKRKFLFFAITVSVSLVVSSCSLFNPYIDPSKVEINTAVSNVDPVLVRPCFDSPGNMQAARRCALAMQSEYIGNMRDQALLSSISGVSLIALTAYTTGVAIKGTSTSKVTDYAMGTAALYGMSQWLSQPERSKIYGLGVLAIQCAIDATVPFQAHAGKLTEFGTNLSELDTAMSNTKTALGTVDNLLSSKVVYANTDKNGIGAYANSVRELLGEANTAYEQGQELSKLHQRAPHELVSSIGSINATITKGLSETIQSMNALPGALSGVLSMYSDSMSSLSALGYSPKPITEDLSEGDAQSDIKGSNALLDAFNELTKANAELVTTLSAVKPYLTLLSPDLPEGALEQCGVDLSGVNQPIKLNPQSLKFASSSASMLSVHASGGGGKYVATYDTSAFEIKQIPAFGSTFQIKPLAAASGNYIVTISDISGKQALLQAQVESAEPPAPQEITGPVEPADNSVCTPNAASEKPGEMKEEICLKRFTDNELDITLTDPEKTFCTDAGLMVSIQVKLKQWLNKKDPPRDLCHDGFYGPTTREALLEWREGDPRNLAKDQVITQEDIDALQQAVFDSP